MPNLKEVRTRITSVNSTRQITSAMKMVSASKLRRAQNAIIKLRPYSAKLTEILQNLSSNIENTNAAAYYEKRKVEKVLIIAVSSNRGMCGAFNTNIIKAVNLLIQDKYKIQNNKGDVEILCIGKKAGDFFTRRNFKIIERLDHIFDKLSFDNIVPVAEQLMNDFKNKKYDKIEIVYNRFKNAATQQLVVEQFLPVLSPSILSIKSTTADYIFEPDKKQILDELVPKTLKIQLYKVVLDSWASEQGARMTAMHKATDNATEMLKQLRLSYNKARQAAITNEILEIVGGAEALKG
ncbi:MAG: ATP synthase F1 subunit gamma [Bacteroidetes bacterium]|nr:ATP synthase F1 subunit gamma [Bacteroidota bacterium]